MQLSKIIVPLGAIIACLLWSSAFVGIKIGLEYTTPIQFAGIRFMLSGIMIFTFLKNKRQYIENVKQHFKPIALVALLHTFLQYFFFYMALERTPASISAIVIGTTPLFVAIVAHIALPNDRLTTPKLVGILLGMIGITMVILGKGGDTSFVGIEVWIGIGLLLLCNMNSGLSNIIMVTKAKGVPALVLSSFSLFIGGFMLFLLSIPLEGLSLPDSSYPREYFVALGWLSFISAGAFSIWMTLLKRPEVKVSELNLYKFIIPVSGAILSWILLPSESPNTISIVGMIIAGGSLLLVNYYNRRESKK